MTTSRSRSGSPRRHRTAAGSPLAALVTNLADAGLRPVADPALDLVRADCPDCNAGSSDPRHLYRPLVVACRSGTLRTRCDACNQGGKQRL
jgi:hypothetical protein